MTAVEPPGGRVRVAHLLGVAELARAEVVAGQPGLQQEIADVTVVDGLGDTENLTRGALVVTAVRVSAGYELEVLVRAAHARGCVALVAVGDARVLVSTRRMCDRLVLPLLAMPQAQPVRLAALLARYVHEPLHLAVRRIVAVTRALPVAPANPEQILRPVREQLGAPVALLGRDRTVLSGPEDFPAIDVPGLAPHPQVLGHRGGHLVVAPVVVEDPLRPDLWAAALLPPSHEIWLDGVTQLLKTVAFAVASLTARQRVRAEQDARESTALLAELMNSSQALDRHTVERALRVGWRLDGWHTGAYLRAAGDDGAIPSATDLIERALRDARLRGHLVERPDGWVFWSTTDREPPSSSFRDARVALARVVAAVADEVALFGGVGRPYEGGGGIARTLQEAREASLFAGASGRRGRVEHVDELGARRYLARWHQSEAFSSYARTLLAPLLEGPEALLDTLHVYLDRESSASATATRLGIHRNTVNQRIERAQQLLAVDLTLPDDRLVVHLACRVLRGAERGG